MKTILKHGTGILALTATCTFAGFTVIAPPPPELCRAHGVAVPDGAEPTGEIVEYHISDPRTVSARCMSPWVAQKGCAIPVAPGQYVVWVAEQRGETDYAVHTHEQCHAIYETRAHAGGKDDE